MSVGFVTASGKGVKVSDEALQKAKHLFEQLDNDGDSLRSATEDTSNSRCCSVKNNVLAPLPTLFNATGRNSKQISSTFKSPLVKNGWRYANKFVTYFARYVHVLTLSGILTSCSSSFNSPIKKIAKASEQSTAVTPKSMLDSVCGKIGNVTPIKLLTPYCKNWRLCIKVTSIDEANTSPPIHLDDSGVEIRVSACGDTAYRIAPRICSEQMYYITRASVKMANRRYGRNKHDMEVVLRPDSEVTKCTDRPHILSPKMNFEFVRIRNLQSFIDAEIDVLGTVIDIGEMKILKSKAGEELQKREIQIVDDTSYCVTITLWGQKAKIFPGEQYQRVLVAKGFLVRCFQETISLVSITSSKLLHDPHFPEADALRLWYNENKDKTFKPASLNQVLSFQEHKWIRQLKLLQTGHFFNLTAMISSIFTENAVYKGCLTCKKKLLVEKGGDLYICAKCGICNEYKYYYTLHMELSDLTGTVSVTAFDNCAQKLIGDEADEVAKFLKFDNDRYQLCFKSVLFKPYMFRISAQRRGSIDCLTAVAKPGQTLFWSMKDLTPMPFDSYCTFLQHAVEHAGAGTSK
uniref:Replication protein A subunit n=1 Tax=Setaria digitata TaxID=48799 RepID=A0A915PB15_9BILA